MKIIKVNEEEVSTLNFLLELAKETKKRGELDDNYVDMLAMMNQMDFKDNPPGETLVNLLASGIAFIRANEEIYEQFKDFLWERK